MRYLPSLSISLITVALLAVGGCSKSLSKPAIVGTWKAEGDGYVVRYVFHGDGKFDAVRDENIRHENIHGTYRLDGADLKILPYAVEVTGPDEYKLRRSELMIDKSISMKWTSAQSFDGTLGESGSVLKFRRSGT